MPKIIKPANIGNSGDVVLIPDAPQPARAPVRDACAGAPAQASKVELVPPEQVYENIIQKAREDAEQLSEKIMRLGRMERDILVKQANEEAEKIRQQAYEEGLARGSAERIQEITGCINEIGVTLRELREEHARYMKQYERELRDFALEIASEVMHKRITDYGADMAELVEHALASVKDADWITVEVSDKLPQLVEVLEQGIVKNEKGRVEITPKGLPPGSCILQTPEGIIDASIDTQLANLREYLNQAC